MPHLLQDHLENQEDVEVEQDGTLTHQEEVATHLPSVHLKVNQEEIIHQVRLNLHIFLVVAVALLNQVDLVDTQVVTIQAIREERVVMENKLNLHSLVQQHQVMVVAVVL